MPTLAPPGPTATELIRVVTIDRGDVLVDNRTGPDGWVLSATGHDTMALWVDLGAWAVLCSRCGCELDGPWVSPLGALDAAAGHAARP